MKQYTQTALVLLTLTLAPLPALAQTTDTTDTTTTDTTTTDAATTDTATAGTTAGTTTTQDNDFDWGWLGLLGLAGLAGLRRRDESRNVSTSTTTRP